MKAVVGSSSQRKIDSVRKVLKEFLTEDTEVSSFSAKSNVPDTPYEEKTLEGARNRAASCREKYKDVDYYIGLESGLVKRYGHLFEEAWAVVINKQGQEFLGYSSGLKVPDFITKKMQDSGKEHFEIMKLIEEEFNLPESDTWSSYSGGLILRDISLEEALRNAIIQSISNKKSLYHL